MNEYEKKHILKKEGVPELKVSEKINPVEEIAESSNIRTKNTTGREEETDVEVTAKTLLDTMNTICMEVAQERQETLQKEQKLQIIERNQEWSRKLEHMASESMQNMSSGEMVDTIFEIFSEIDDIMFKNKETI